MEQLRDEMSAENKALIADSYALSDRIAFLLEKHNLSQKQLAAKLKKRESEISKWLSGGHNFTQSTLTKISLAIGEAIYEIPSQIARTSYLPSIAAEEKFYSFRCKFSRYATQQLFKALIFENYQKEECSKLSVSSRGIILNQEISKEDFTKANIEEKDLKRIEGASIS